MLPPSSPTRYRYAASAPQRTERRHLAGEERTVWRGYAGDAEQNGNSAWCESAIVVPAADQQHFTPAIDAQKGDAQHVRCRH